MAAAQTAVPRAAAPWTATVQATAVVASVPQIGTATNAAGSDTATTDSFIVSSREDAANKPQLVVTFQ